MPDMLDAIGVRTLTRTHPLYARMLPAWVSYLDLYEGENLHRYIHRHARESRESHAMRAKRIIYRNFCAPVVDLYLHYIFSKHITRQPGTSPTPIAEEWARFLTDVDRRHGTIDAFMTQVARCALIFGHVFVLVDVPYTSRQPHNEAERRAMLLSPYCSLYFPTEAVNWALDDDGKLLWIRFREPLPDQADPFQPFSVRDIRAMIEEDPLLSLPASPAPAVWARRTSRARYRTWTRTEWAIHEVRGDNVACVAYGEHGLGEVPVVPVYNRRSARYPFIGQSLISDISKLNIGILNIDSMIDEAVYQQTINILVIGRQPTDADEIIIGTNNVLEYSGDRPPYFLSPSTAPVAFMEERIARMREEIYRLAKLGGGLGLEPRGSPSGIALAFEFNETNAVLAERADELERAEREIHRLWHRWFGIDWDGAVDYPNDFSIQSFLEELQIVTVGGDAIRSPTFRRALEKRAARRILRNADAETLSQIEREIDFIPEMIRSFSGPVFYDPILQEIRLPGMPNPIGALREMAEGAQQGAEPQQGTPPPPHGTVPPEGPEGEASPQPGRRPRMRRTRIDRAARRR